MNSTGPVAWQEAPADEAPLYDALIRDLGWSPEDLRPPFQLDAMIAASYGTVIVNAAVARSARSARPAAAPSAAVEPGA